MDNKINAAKVKSIKTPGMFRADDTLYICVKESGRRSWIQRISYKGRRHDIGLGPYPVVTLAEARDMALDNRRMIRKGIDPLTERRKPKTPSFKQAAIDTHKDHTPTWSKRHSDTWMQMLEKHAFPKLSNRPVHEITQSDVLDVLKPVWSKRPETARRVRQRIRTILKYCQSKEYVKENVADGRIDGALPSMTKQKGNFRALDYREMPEAYRIIGTQFKTPPSRLCLLFLVLTASRSGEARGARWSEIDLDPATWEIPASRMKAGKSHRIALSRSALAVLEQAKGPAGRVGPRFPIVGTSRASDERSGVGQTDEKGPALPPGRQSMARAPFSNRGRPNARTYPAKSLKCPCRTKWATRSNRLTRGRTCWKRGKGSCSCGTIS